MKTWVPAIAGLLCAANMAQAQPCGYGPSYGSYYSREYVIKKEYVPVVVPVSYPTVAIPVYSYVNAAYVGQPYPYYPAPGYTAPGYTAPGYPGAYPAPGYPGMSGYPGGQQAPTAEQVADVVMKRLEGRLNLQPLPQQQTPQQAVPQQQTPRQVPKTGGGPPAVTGPAVSAPANVVTKLTAKCANCHSLPNFQGGFAMFNESRQLVALSREDRFDIWDQVYQGTMPKGETPFTDSEAEEIRAWARQK